MSPDNALWVAAGIGTAGVAVGTVHRFVIQPLLRLFQRLNRHMDAWAGEPARDGLPARPGVIDRLVSIESELKPNSGTSLRDAVDKTRDALTEHMEASAALLLRGAETEANLHAADAANTARLDSIDESLERIEAGDTVSGRLVSEAMPVVARATPADIDIHPKD